MKNKAVKVAKMLFPILLWLSVWQILALVVNHPYFLPTVPKTLHAVWDILTSVNSYKIMALTLLRVLIGFLLGILAGAILAVISYKFEVVRIAVTPMISIIKSTPVAAMLVLLYVLLRGNVLPVFIAFLMVMPLIWQNLTDGFDSIDKNLAEVCDSYGFSFFKRMRILVFPALMKYLIPAVITGCGLAWKSEISAEIIVYTADSVGAMINDAKYAFDTASVFGWSFIIVITSIAIEKLARLLLARYKL